MKLSVWTICPDSLIVGLLLSLLSKTTAQIFLTADDFLRALKEDNVTFLTDTDFVNANKYKEFFSVNSSKNKLRPKNILSAQKYYRGDIRGKAALRREKHHKLKKPDSLLSDRNVRRNGVTSVVKKWPSARIPYVLSTQYSEKERAILARAFQEYHSRTCIRFTPRNAFDRDYLYIGKIDGCYSDVGRAGGKQELSLDDGCLHLDTIIHELMHSVGFYHEHERWDRDHFISILWQNIDRDAYDQFGRVDLQESSYYGQPYDYRSIMHYDSMAFSKNGRETLIAKSPAMTHVIGSALDFSPTDLSKIQRMYQCSGFAEPIDTSGLEFSNSISGRMASAPVLRPYNSLLLPGHSPSGTQLSHAPAPSVTNSFIPRALPVQTHDPTTFCVDRATLCWRWLDRCNSFFFETIMREFCALSCKFCTPNDTKNKIVPNSPSQIQKSLRDESYHPNPQETTQMRSYPVVNSYPVMINAPAN